MRAMRWKGDPSEEQAMTAMNAMNQRRDLLKLLVAGGVLGPAAAAAMQEDAKLTTSILERAAALFEAGIDPAHIRLAPT